MDLFTDKKNIEALESALFLKKQIIDLFNGQSEKIKRKCIKQRVRLSQIKYMEESSQFLQVLPRNLDNAKTSKSLMG